MKCARHPNREAVANCVACSRAICEHCQTNFMGVPHCRMCAKLISRQMVMSAKRQPPVAIPRSTIRRELFILGGIGGVIIAIGACVMGYYMLYLVHNLLFAQNLEWFVIASVIVAVGLVLTGIGCYGFYYNLGTSIGLVASVLLVVSALFFPVSIIFAVAALGHGYSIGPEYAVGVVTLGISLILTGVTFSKVKYHITTGNLAQQAAIINIIVGCIFCSVIFAIFFGLAYFALIIASLISAVTFLKMQIPRDISTPPSGSTKKEEEVSLKDVGE